MIAYPLAARTDRSIWNNTYNDHRLNAYRLETETETPRWNPLYRIPTNHRSIQPTDHIKTRILDLLIPPCIKLVVLCGISRLGSSPSMDAACSWDDASNRPCKKQLLSSAVPAPLPISALSFFFHISDRLRPKDCTRIFPDLTDSEAEDGHLGYVANASQGSWYGRCKGDGWDSQKWEEA